MSVVQGCLDCPMLAEVLLDGVDVLECGADGHAIEPDIDLATTVCAGCPMAGKTLVWPAHVERQADAIAQAASPLDNPRMDGNTWIAPTDEECDAWPTWEHKTSHGIDILTAQQVQGLRRRHARYRPLRLFGMNARGEVAARDMTPAHFERVAAGQWQFSDDRRHSWHRLQEWRGMDAVIVRPDSTWRPVIFARLARAS